ncbi:MAG: hypothetical protein H0V01_09880 [Bacteroidetes bacterium]|nr:hypothetical protein [Bacteroidota bacterium]HET6244540.1 hypothetical protein [Bacteroidia bacterium]
MKKIKFILVTAAIALFLALNACVNVLQKTPDTCTQFQKDWTKKRILEHVQNWPKTASKAAKTMVEKYGLPDEITEYRLIWHNKGDFKETIVFREEVNNNFPFPHKAVLEQSINYTVPMDKLADISKYSGNIVVDRTKGKISARCDNEYMNYLTLNLAHEIAIGERTVEDAREFLATNVIAYLSGDTSLFMHDFLFTPPLKTGDADEAIIDDEIVKEILDQK